MNLHPFQNDIVENVSRSFRSVRSVCIVLPTGAGKTIIAGEISRRIFRQMQGQKGVVCLYLVHRQELLWQTVRTLKQFGLDRYVGIVAAGQHVIRQMVYDDRYSPDVLDKLVAAFPTFFDEENIHRFRAKAQSGEASQPGLLDKMWDLMGYVGGWAACARKPGIFKPSSGPPDTTDQQEFTDATDEELKELMAY